jgi:AcrR family transcriptional regulator
VTGRALTPKGQATRSRVLTAAVELVAERGVAAVTLDDVQERAGVSRGQLYHYFAGRSELLHAVVDATADWVIGAQRELLGALDSWAALERWLLFVESMQATRARSGCPLGTLVGQLVPQDDGSRRALAAAFDRWEGHLSAGLRTLGERGELRSDVDSARLATAVLAALQGGYLMSQVRGDHEHFRRATDGARAILRDARSAG